MDQPRICIIGAGFSGVSTAKALSARGIPYVCYEMSDTPGGLWVYKNENGLSSAYRSLHIDTSKQVLQYPDYPMPAHYATYPGHAQMREYIADVVDHFGLAAAICFNTRVTEARLGPDGAWQVTLDTGETRPFDYLIVCNGHHWDPLYPDFPGRFDGTVLHSHDYRDPFDPIEMRSKRIVVVGMGNSALDIACELSNPGIAARLTLSTRRGAYIVPKYLFGKPIDQVLRISPRLPYRPQRRAAGLLLRLAVGRMETYGLPRPNHAFGDTHPAVSSEFLYKAANGDITVAPNVARLAGPAVQFVDGSEAECDVLIYATGYRVSFPFFDPGFISAPDNALPLFMRIFKPGLPNLMFVGLGQALPSVIRFIQDQAQLVAAYLAGEYALPSEAEMAARIVSDTRRHAAHYVASPRHAMQVDSNIYRMDLSRELRRGRRRAEQLKRERA